MVEGLLDLCHARLFVYILVVGKQALAVPSEADPDLVVGLVVHVHSNLLDNQAHLNLLLCDSVDGCCTFLSGVSLDRHFLLVVFLVVVLALVVTAPPPGFGSFLQLLLQLAGT